MKNKTIVTLKLCKPLFHGAKFKKCDSGQNWEYFFARFLWKWGKMTPKCSALRPADDLKWHLKLIDRVTPTAYLWIRRYFYVVTMAESPNRRIKGHAPGGLLNRLQPVSPIVSAHSCFRIMGQGDSPPQTAPYYCLLLDFLWLPFAIFPRHVAFLFYLMLIVIIYQSKINYLFF